MITINLERSPFLAFAVDYIKTKPGCSKKDIVLAWGRGKMPPSKTLSGQYSRLSDLIAAGLVQNKGTAAKYSLHAS
jgi:hypothetical protein